MLDRAGDIAQRLGGDMGVARRRHELGVTEQDLDHAGVRIGLQYICGKAVPKRMQHCAPCYPSYCHDRVERPVQ